LVIISFNDFLNTVIKINTTPARLFDALKKVSESVGLFYSIL